jgi:hypothetical protein
MVRDGVARLLTLRPIKNGREIPGRFASIFVMAGLVPAISLMRA